MRDPAPLPTLPDPNAASYPKTLTAVTEASIREVMLHYAHGPSTSARHHLIAAGLELMLGVSSLKNVALRSVIERAGYGFSRFYKIWPNMETYRFDVWRFGLACHSLSELEHLRQLGGDSLEAFADCLAHHLVLAQHHVSPLLFKQILNDHAGGNIMNMLSHTPQHIRATHAMLLMMFPHDAEELPLERFESFAWMAATYLFTRMLDESRSISDEAAIDVLRKQLLSFRPDNTAN